jgi:hypothetical protein
MKKISIEALHNRLFPAIAEVKYNPLAWHSAKRGLKEIKKWEGKGYICIHKSPNEGHRIFKRPEHLAPNTETAMHDSLAAGGIQIF